MPLPPPSGPTILARSAQRPPKDKVRPFLVLSSPKKQQKKGQFWLKHSRFCWKMVHQNHPWFKMVDFWRNLSGGGDLLHFRIVFRTQLVAELQGISITWAVCGWNFHDLFLLDFFCWIFPIGLQLDQLDTLGFSKTSLETGWVLWQMLPIKLAEWWLTEVTWPAVLWNYGPIPEWMDDIPTPSRRIRGIECSPERSKHTTESSQLWPVNPFLEHVFIT